MAKNDIFEMISEDFEEIKEMCDLLKKYRKSDFGRPATAEEIENWENENSVKLPEMLKCWYMITSKASIVGGAYEIFMPVPADGGRYLIGKLIDDGEDLYYSPESDEICSEFGGESEEYSDFEDFLSYIMMNLQDTADGILGEE